jgi:toxin YoeB
VPKGQPPAQKLDTVWSPEALKQVAAIKAWRDQPKAQKYLETLGALIEDAREHPFEGLGKPEPLKYRVPPCWSRRINLEDRLVYRVHLNELEIITVLGHYEK